MVTIFEALIKHKWVSPLFPVLLAPEYYWYLVCSVIKLLFVGLPHCTAVMDDEQLHEIEHGINQPPFFSLILEQYKKE